MLHDEAIYGADTDRFIPERFLNPGMKDPTAAFGFGRRQGFSTFDIQSIRTDGKEFAWVNISRKIPYL
jgi:hypothetical protein